MGTIGSSSPPAPIQQPTRRMAGAAIPDKMGTTTGSQVRITPQNYREVLGANADVLLTPKDMKELYEKGHLDVQRHMQTAESNEGFITLASKLAAALVGPSRSVGAISIDPLFLEMIKDPNAEIGPGYTRIRNETISVLSSPEDEAPVGDAPPVEVPAPPINLQHYEADRRKRDEQAKLDELPYVNRPTPVPVKEGLEYVVETSKIDAGEKSGYAKVGDSTFSGAYIEAATQDRELSEAHQRVQRLNIDMNSMVSRNSKGQDTSVLKARINTYLKRAGITDVTADSLLRMKPAQRSQFMDRAAKTISNGQFTNFAASSKVEKHAQDFRAIGYVSVANAQKGADHIGQLSTTQANNILNKEITGTHSNRDGVVHHYDTVGLLEGRKIQPSGADPGYPAFASDPKYAGATTLYDVYSMQTEQTAIPDEAMDDYTRLYNTEFGTSMTVDQMKDLEPSPTLKDMYALRTNNFNGSVSVSADGGRVKINGDQTQAMRKIANVRLVLEANTPGITTHVFDAAAVSSVNDRAAYNFKDTPIFLQDNTDKELVDKSSPRETQIAQTVDRFQLKQGVDVDALDTQMFNADENRQLEKVGYGFRGTSGSDSPAPGGVSPTTGAVLDPTGAGVVINNNIAKLNQPGILGGGAGDTDYGNFAKVDAQVQSLQASGQDLKGVTFKDASGQQIMIKDPATSASRPATLADWGSASEPGPLRKQVEATALSGSEGPADAASLQDAIGKNMQQLVDLEKEVKGQFPPRFSGSELDSMKATITGQIEALKTAEPKVDAAVIKGLEDQLTTLLAPEGALRTAAAKEDEAMRADGLTNLDGAPPAGGVNPAGGAASKLGNDFGLLNKSLTDFHKYVKASIADGKISSGEQQTIGQFRDQMQGFVESSVKNTQGRLGALTDAKDPSKKIFDASELTPVSNMLQNVTKERLIAGGVSEMESAEIMTNMSKLKSAQSSVNVISEASTMNSLYQGMRSLDKRLDKFDAEEVVKTAFRGEMQTLAKTNPAGFQDLMAVTYSMPPLQAGDTSSAAAVAYKHLTDMAIAGTLPVPPNVELVSRESIGGANGAYNPDNGGTILLASDLISRDNQGNTSMSEKGKDVFAEEMFHHLETQVEIQTILGSDKANQDASGNPLAPNNGGKIDAAGDEGRAGLSALIELRRNPKAQQSDLRGIADNARKENANVDDKIKVNSESRDQGTLNANLQVDGKTILREGAVLEFSSDPAGQVPVTGTSNSGAQASSGTEAPSESNPDAWNTPGIRPHQGQAMAPLHDSGSFTNASFDENFPQVNRLGDDNAEAQYTAEEPGLGSKIGKFAVGVAAGLSAPLYALGDALFELSDKMKQTMQKHWAGIANSNLAGSEATESDSLGKMGMRLKGSDSLNDKHIRNLKYQDYSTLAPQYDKVLNQNKQSQAAYRRGLETAGASDEVKQRAAEAAQSRGKNGGDVEVNGTVRAANWQLNS